MDYIRFSAVPGYSQEEVSRLLDEASALRSFRQSAWKAVYSVADESRGGELFVKKWREVGPLRHLKNRLRGGSRATREASNAKLLRDGGIGVPRVVASGDFREPGAPGYVSFMITEGLRDACIYYDVARKYYDGQISREVFQGLADMVAEAIAAMHLAGITHHDLNMENILIASGQDGTPQIYFLDTLAVQRRSNRALFALIDMAQFYFLALDDPSGITIGEAEADYVLREYHGRAASLFPVGYPAFGLAVRSLASVVKRTRSIIKVIRQIQ